MRRAIVDLVSWWIDATIYQIYPRSFQDSDGDGVGDLAGIRRRLDHLARLGVDAIWLSPVYPSPGADLGYDISDFTGIDAAFGTLETFDALVHDAHERGIRVLLDLVPCHSSTEHPWFSERPDFYVWAGDRGGRPPNNWVSAFGGPAWSFDEARGRWYLHSFYSEQADLDWRNPAVVSAMQEVIRFWAERGIDGFRVDALDRLMKDPELRDDPLADTSFALPVVEVENRALTNSRNGPGLGEALAAIRAAAGDLFLVGEVYLPAELHPPYLEHLDAVFAFELFHAPWDAVGLRRAIERGIELATPARRGPAWVLSNHDFPRLATRVGPANARAAATLLLTLPGPVFLYQGEEIGQIDGPGADPPIDRAGRDSSRHPVQWEPEPLGGFTTGDPWLAPVDPLERSVAAQSGDAQSDLELTRALIALRPRLGSGIRLLDAAPGLLAFARGDEHVVVINTTERPVPFSAGADPVVETHPGALRDGRIAGHAAVVCGPPAGAVG